MPFYNAKDALLQRKRCPFTTQKVPFRSAKGHLLYFHQPRPLFICGTSQARSQLTVILKEWKQRDDTTIGQIMQDVQDELKQYPECKVYLSTPPVIPGLGTSGGFEMQLEARGDATYDDLVRATWEKPFIP